MFEVASFSAPTGTGTTEFNVSGMGTPIACVLELSRSGAPNTGSDLAASRAFTDGTTHACMANYYVNTSTTTFLTRYSTNRLACLLSAAGTVAGSISFHSFVADTGFGGGLKVTIDTSFPAGWIINIRFLTEGTVACGIVNTTSAPMSVPIGFQPDAVEFLGSVGVGVYNDSNQNTAIFCAGMAGWDDHGVLSQGSLAWLFFWYALAAQYRQALYLSTTDVFQYLNGTVTDDAVRVTGRSSTSFSMDYGAIVSGGVYDIPYLAWKGATAKSVVVKDFQFPTSTGNHGYTGLGPVEFVSVLTTQAASADSIITNFGATSVGFGDFNSTSEEASFFGAKDASGSGSFTNGTSFGGQAAQAIELQGIPILGASLRHAAATLTSFDSDGYTLNFSVTIGNVHFLSMSVATVATSAPGIIYRGMIDAV